MIGHHSSQAKRVLVTGASGFIGQHLLTALLNCGYKVLAHTNKRDLPQEVKDQCERVVSGNICDGITQEDLLRDVHVVLHLAAHIPSQFTELQDANPCYLVNARATLDLAQKAAAVGVRRFVYFSTGNMYSEVGRACTESDCVFPAGYATDYFVSKLSAEIYLMNLAQRLPMEVIILRVATPYGPGEPSNKVIPTFLRSAAQRQPLHLINGGSATNNFVFVADVVDLAVRAIESGSQGIYNVASGEITSILNLANIIVSLYQDREVVIDLQPKMKDAFQGFPLISIEKARKTFGFSPRSLTVGLMDYRKSIDEENRRCE